MKYFFGVFILLLDFMNPTTTVMAFESMPILIPNAIRKEPEAYLCSAHSLDVREKKFVVGFEPQASMKVVHHMLLYGCSIPGQDSGIWDCGSMSSGQSSQLKSSPVCQEGQDILYAWGRDATKLELPAGVGFEIGNGTGIAHLVVQIHYTAYPAGILNQESSGLILNYTMIPQPRTAGVIVLASGGSILPKSSEHFDIACRMNDEDFKEITPFRFRTHTHTLGRMVSGYRVRRDANGRDDWVRIGKRNPLLPQAFYPVENNVTVRRGDTLAARCTMVNNRDTLTEVGGTSDDEMCNFYVMYWTDNGRLKRFDCGSPGPPRFYWDTPGSLVLNNFPRYFETDDVNYVM